MKRKTENRIRIRIHIVCKMYLNRKRWSACDIQTKRALSLSKPNRMNSTEIFYVSFQGLSRSRSRCVCWLCEQIATTNRINCPIHSARESTSWLYVVCGSNGGGDDGSTQPPWLCTIINSFSDAHSLSHKIRTKHSLSVSNHNLAFYIILWGCGIEPISSRPPPNTRLLLTFTQHTEPNPIKSSSNLVRSKGDISII